MNRFLSIGLFLLFPCLSLFAQIDDFGAIGSFSTSKNFGRSLEAKFEQEFRINQNLSSFNRSLSSLSIDYTIIRKLLHAQIDYDFLYQRQNTYFEVKQRASIALSVSRKINSFDFELRTRGQSVWRDENRGDYKFNPKYIWRNKLECSYTIYGSPIKPFVSAEIFCPLNSEHGFLMDGFRASGGAKYKLTAHSSVAFSLRYDQDVQQANPKNAIYTVIGWNYKL